MRSWERLSDGSRFALYQTVRASQKRKLRAAVEKILLRGDDKLRAELHRSLRLLLAQQRRLTTK